MRVAGLGLSLLLVAGCSGASAPAEAVPALGSILGRVDRAIAGKQFDQARQELDRLVQTTLEAREAGDLDSAQAEPILAAVISLTTKLPRPQPADDKMREELEKEREKLEKELEAEKKKLAESKEEAANKQEETRQGDPQQGEPQHEEPQHEDKNKEDKKKQDKRGGDEGGKEEGGGNGRSSKHRPDDGHGN
ncbi:hypothetical protein [Actinopolymorpha pittospori]|uniref:Membrane protein n=1 Tax=Actinopolymorpha pittospori TaxID=648752 RepID=A0A927RHD9_9ACTN|nr:hypothetical protein [Actinopolymorpha pittospori]MBE1603348.1 putative membrane protein [Actinopolymorpha pittospori]